MFLQIPLNLPCSVTLQPGPEDTGKVTSSHFLLVLQPRPPTLDPSSHLNPLLAPFRPVAWTLRSKPSVPRTWRRRSIKGKKVGGATVGWPPQGFSTVMSLPDAAPVQELGEAGDPEGAVRSGESGTSANGGDHQAVPDVRQTAAPGGLAGQGGTGRPLTSQRSELPASAGPFWFFFDGSSWLFSDGSLWFLPAGPSWFSLMILLGSFVAVLPDSSFMVLLGSSLMFPLGSSLTVLLGSSFEDLLGSLLQDPLGSSLMVLLGSSLTVLLSSSLTVLLVSFLTALLGSSLQDLFGSSVTVLLCSSLTVLLLCPPRSTTTGSLSVSTSTSPTTPTRR